VSTKVASILPPDVSLFSGGIVQHLVRRAGVKGRDFMRLRLLSIVIAPAVCWIPLAILAAIEGTLLPKSVSVPFLIDVGAHVRFLVVVPLLILGGIVAEQRIRPTIEQFVSRHLIPDDKLDDFGRALRSSLQRGDSVVADVVILLLIYGVIAPVFWRTHAASASTWFVSAASAGSKPTLAGLWYAYVSLPLLQLVLLRWYYRLFLWTWFLFRTARMNLRLLATHPDKLGGLGFLILATQGLTFFAMAHGALLAGWLANRIWIGGIVVTKFKTETILVLVFVLLITLLPLLAFTRPLVLAKRRGTLVYGELAAGYAREFDSKWIEGQHDPSEHLVGSADVQSMADMGGTYELVREMRSVPLTVQTVVGLAVATMLPVFPLLLTVMPLGQLLKKLAGILLP